MPGSGNNISNSDNNNNNNPSFGGTPLSGNYNNFGSTPNSSHHSLHFLHPSQNSYAGEEDYNNSNDYNLNDVVIDGAYNYEPRQSNIEEGQNEYSVELASIVEEKNVPDEDLHPFLLEWTDIKWVKMLGEGTFGEVNLYQVINPQKLKELREMDLIAPDSDQIAIKTIRSVVKHKPKYQERFRHEMRSNYCLYQNRSAVLTPSTPGPQDRLLKNSQRECHFNFAYPGFGLDDEPFILSRVEKGGSAASFIEQWRSEHFKNTSDENLEDNVKDTIILLITMAVEIWAGMEQIHRLNILHGDLSLYNILISKSNSEITVKLADFGLSRFYNAKYPDMPLFVPKPFQDMRTDVERSQFDKLSLTTEVFGFKVLFMEMIGEMAGIDFATLLLNLRDTKFQDIKSRIDEQNYQPDLINAEIVKSIQTELEKALQEKFEANPSLLNKSLQKLLKNLERFLEWEKKEKAPSQHMRDAKIKLITQLNAILVSQMVESNPKTLSRTPSTSKLGALSRTPLTKFNNNNNAPDIEEDNIEGVKSLANELSPKLRTKKANVFRFFKEKVTTSFTGISGSSKRKPSF